MGESDGFHYIVNFFLSFLFFGLQLRLYSIVLVLDSTVSSFKLIFSIVYHELISGTSCSMLKDLWFHQ